MSEIKLCKDCKYKRGVECTHPYVGYHTCSTERAIEYELISVCGPKAKLFEQKQPDPKPWWRLW